MIEIEVAQAKLMFVAENLCTNTYTNIKYQCGIERLW